MRELTTDEALMLALGSEAIPVIERAAQLGMAVAADTRLPAECRDQALRVALEAAGVIFGEVDAGDPIFQHVTLPAGWRIKPSGHQMWSDLIDADGNSHAEIFFKAASYDRKAALYPPQ